MYNISFQTRVPELMFSSQIPDVVKVKTDMPSVVFRIRDCGVTSENSIILLPLDAFDDEICIYDLRSVIEDYMAGKGIAFASFELVCDKVDTGEGYAWDSLVLNVLYCSHGINCSASWFASHFFLTTLRGKLSYRNVEEDLYYYMRKGESGIISYQMVVSDNGTTKPLYKSVPVSADRDMVRCLPCGYGQMARLMELKDGVTILSVSITIGERSFSMFYSDGVPSVDFYFRNAFNVYEHCPIVCKTTEKTSTERSIAMCNGRQSFYDQKDSRKNEIETAPLSPLVARWMSQLAISREAYIAPSCTDDVTDMHEILVTDSDLAISDTDDEMNIVKLTWEYPDGKPDIEMGIEGSVSNLYSKEYNETYG